MSEIVTWENFVSLVSLCAMEIVLGIDNIVFLAILSQRLPAQQQRRARRLGLSLALILRLGLLFTLTWIMGLTRPLFGLFGHGFSGRDLVLLGGGLFLLAKSAHEIYDKVEGGDTGAPPRPGDGRAASFGGTMAQILALDVVFSLDSVITAVGMVGRIWVMVVAMVVAVGVMLLAAETISEFINRHPSMKVLALSFLLLIGVLLVVEGFGKHIEKGYVYFAMAFAFAVEMLNIGMRRKQRPAVTVPPPPGH
jgi:predicted tellurium resistance membrane protein TerC